MGQQKPANSQNDLDLYKLFPFLDSFPFDNYRISLERDKFNAKDLGIDPIIVNSLSESETPDLINFHYTELASKIMISFYKNDIIFLKEKSEEITVLDSIRKTIDTGLTSHIIKTKIDAIKKSESFIKLLNPGLLAASNFNEVLLDLLKLNNIELSEKLVDSIQKMRTNIKQEKFDDIELQVIKSFYNFKLHHVKILLGIIISAKIY